MLSGKAAPLIFGALIASQQAVNVFYGYLVGAGLMIAGGLVEFFFGVDAEQRSLEDVAAPLSEVTEAPRDALQPVLAAAAS